MVANILDLVMHFSIQLAGVLLVGLLLVGLILSLERLYFLHRGKIKPESLLSGLENLLQRDRPLEALTICEQTPGALARVLKRMLLLRNSPAEKIQQEYLLQASWEVQIMERRLRSVGMLAKLLPLLGFLGTAIALLRAFWQFGALTPYASLQQFSNDFTAAFAFSIMGIGGGIVLQLAYHFLYGRLQSSIRDLESAARQLFCQLTVGHSSEIVSHG